MAHAISRLSDTRCELAEGPTWDERLQRLYWCDILGKRIHALDWQSREEQHWEMPDVVGSLGLTEDEDRLVVALRDRVVLFTLSTGAMELLAEIETDDARTRLNDGKVGPDGAFYVGTMDDRPDRQPIGALYRVARTGGATRLVDGVTVSNGLAWSPEGTVLYHADSRPGHIEAWNFDAATGAISARRLFAQLTNETGRPDGGTVDAEGRYWSAGVSAGLLNCFAPDGTLIEAIAMPVPRPTMPCFCGPALDELVVTSLRPHNAPDLLSEFPDSGCLFVLKTGATGLPASRFRL
ncbi:SMP-30/gluconolactonase/LRE family protein [Stappia sp. 28M-7]|uniref:SMP-30/gluconolactonase/LRE family protein n=1 Tax=Stappia sp. 28M-7 TaxID=2762596 RepID=UPI00163D2000|nr:SMP-30/gluconolactonase/LRE family protein [Stappia sp. 28M-7]MBC2860410.1 SMP-30/gluconolactonase/LRE family protein [Stappia sp. 28M-7]